MPVLIDKVDNKTVQYDASYINSDSFGSLNNPLARKIVDTLAVSPMCAIDIAREMGEPEHKVYYHLNKLSKSGIVKLVGTEKRYGMVAQLYDLVSPVVAAKLHDNGKAISTETTGDPALNNFFSPFIEESKFNAKIIVGDPSPHGKYGKGSHYGNYIVDFSLMMGTLVKDLQYPHLKLDTEVNDFDLRDNLILIGSNFDNTIIDKIIDSVPLELGENTIKSKETGKVYDNNIMGYITKFDNPFDSSKKILIIGGVTGKGVRSSVVAVTRDFNSVFSQLVGSKDFVKLVRGIDKDGDRVIDSVDIVE